MGSRRCEIRHACTTQPCPPDKFSACTVGPGGTCKIIDLTVVQSGNPSYYYVVTAVRGSEESALSQENIAWPNYLRQDGVIAPRYDPDDRGDFACDDEVSGLDLDDAPEETLAVFPQGGELSMAQLLAADADREGSAASTGDPASWDSPPSRDADEMLAPYRVIGAFVSNNSGGVNGQALTAQVRWLFMHTDHLGSPRIIFDDAGAIVSTHHLMPFGEEKPLATRVDSNRAYFTGHQRDPETATANNPDGLDYMFARYYSSGMGRFLGVDPGDSVEREDPQTWNRYVYARNNPVLFVDNDGRFAVVGSRTHQSLSDRAPVQPRGVSDRTVAFGNFWMDAQRLFLMGNRRDHLNIPNVAPGSGTDTRVAAGTAALGVAIRQAAVGNVAAAGLALGASQHSFQDLIGHGNVSRDQHYCEANGNNVDSPDSPGFDIRESGALQLTSDVNQIYNQSMIAVENANMTVEEAVNTAEAEAAAAAAAAYASTRETVGGEVEGY